MENDSGNFERDSIVRIQYIARKPRCDHCRGFGHWTTFCERNERESLLSPWNEHITARTSDELQQEESGNSNLSIVRVVTEKRHVSHKHRESRRTDGLTCSLADATTI